MPWTCKSCGGTVTNDLTATCPTCALQKTAWTVAAAVTRTMRVSRRRVTLHRGVATRPGAPAVDPELVETTDASVLDKAYAEALRASGRAPAPADTLYVALAPAGATDLTVRGEVLFAGKASLPFELPLAAPPDLAKDAVVLVPLVFVRGAEPAIARDAFPGITVLDVDEPAPDGAAGHAPSVDVEALGRPAQPVELVVRPFVDQADAHEVLVVIDRPEDLDDRFELASSDGVYVRTLGLADGAQSDRGVVLSFDGLLDGPTYALTHLPDATRRIRMFSGVTKAQLLAPPPAPPVYDPPAPPGEPPEEPWTGHPSFAWTKADGQVDLAWLFPTSGEGGDA